jgi:predicted amidohydrolase YtcJ
VTHEYTLLVGGTVLRGGDRPDASAIAWAADTVIAVGSDDEILGTSRGDSHGVVLGGAIVVGLGATGDRWSPAATLEVGGPADLAVLDDDPRRSEGNRPAVLAIVRGGRLEAGKLPDGPDHRH